MILVVMASAGRVADTGPLTTTALITIAIFAVLVIAGILYGARQKRIRAAGEEAERERAAELAEQDDTPSAPTPEPEPPLAAPAEPVAAKVETPAKAEPAPKPKAAPKPKPTTKTAPTEPAATPKASPRPRAKPAPPEAVVPEPVAPAPALTPTPEPTPAGYALTDVKGLGPKAATLLTGLGIADVASLGALDPARAAEVDGQLGTFAGRLTRDRWVEQAKLLAAGDIATFEAAYGKL